MPKKKTGQRKKAEAQKQRQADVIRAAKTDLSKFPCNSEMQCDRCERRQRNRAFCYFCQSVQRLPMCAQCGRTKCLGQTGECLVRHPNSDAALGPVSATGLALVGCICDHCEAWVCHSRRCIKEHSCPCPLEGAVCVECERTVWEHGGRLYRCGTCGKWLCEDDQFEHQASCQIVLSESLKCCACNRLSNYACLRCKVCFCSEHVAGKVQRMACADSSLSAATGQRAKTSVPCKKCGYPVLDVSTLSLSAKTHEFARQGGGGGGGGDREEDADEDEEGGDGGAGTFSFGGMTVAAHRIEQDDDEEEEGGGGSYDPTQYEDDDEDDDDDEEGDEDGEDDS